MDAYGQQFRDSLALEEYKSLRSESADAKRNQQSIFQWSMATAGVIVAGSVAVTRTTSSGPHANSNGYLAAALTFLMVIPLLMGSAFGAWLGEVQRMERVGRYLRNREELALASTGLQLSSPEADRSFTIQWESLLADKGSQRFYGKNRLGSAAACALFASFFYGSVATGIALLYTSTAKYMATGFWKTGLALVGILESFAFTVTLVRIAFRLARMSSAPIVMPPPSMPTPLTCDIVLPCLNEQEAIHWVCSRLPEVASKCLIDDHSNDLSAYLASALGVTVISNTGLPGVGYASNLGLEQGDSEIICIFDCDGTFDPRWISALTEPIEAGLCDLVIGERDPSSIGWTHLHRILSQVRVKMLRRKFAELPLTDMGSARAIRRAVLEAHQIQPVSTEAWSLDLALKIHRAAGPTRIRQVRVPYLPRIGRSKITGTFRGSKRTAVASLQVIRNS